MNNNKHIYDTRSIIKYINNDKWYHLIELTYKNYELDFSLKIIVVYKRLLIILVKN